MSYVVFDLETTGFSSTTCDIIQFAYIMFDSNNQFVKAENLYFYYEGMSWSQEVADKSHKLSLEFLSQYKDDFNKNLLKMYSVLNRSNVCGYNSNSFDCPFVKNWLSRHGLTDFEFGIQNDCMVALRPVSKKSRFKLVNMAELFNLTEQSIEYCTNIWFGSSGNKRAHDATYDTTATALLTLQALAKNYMTFDVSKISPTQVDADDFNIVDDEHNKPVYENSFAIEAGERTFCFNPDKAKYRDTDGEGLWKLPVKLNMSKDKTVATATSNGCTLVWEELACGCKFTIQTPYVTVNSDNSNVLPLLKSIFKEA